MKKHIKEFLLKTVYFYSAVLRAIRDTLWNVRRINKNGLKSLFWYVRPMFIDVGIFDNKKMYRMTKVYKLPKCKYLRAYLYQTNKVYRLIDNIL